MSVIVKGMEMPERCIGCILCYVGHMGDIMCEMLHRPINVDGSSRDKFCPLIEVPTPHGDLVDRTELLAEYDRQHKGPAGGARRIMEQATAIIKAEESE